MRASRLVTVVLLSALLAAVPAPAGASDPWPSGTHQVALGVERIAGADRYATAVAAARSSFPSWKGVTHVVIASGAKASPSDAVAAASLCWAYDAPLLLVSSTAMPAPVRAALREIRSANPGVSATVVGGPLAVSAAVVGEVRSILGAERVSQPWTTGGRHATAAGVAELVSIVASDTARPLPARALVVNGTDGAGFADAAVAAGVSAATGIPVLYVSRDRVPAPTKEALAALRPGPVIVIGGTAVVSDATYRAVGATSRWAGRTRFTTAVKVAETARARGWLTGATVAMASASPDTVVGAINAGRVGGTLLHVKRGTVGLHTAAYLHRTRGVVKRARLIGGTTVLTGALEAEVKGAPTKPRVIRPKTGARVAKRARVVVGVGVNTTEVRVYAGDKLVGTKAARSYSNVDFGLLPTPPSGSSYKVVARNPTGRTSSVTKSYRRYSYPAPTSIVVDKSDFRLYFFKDDVFVKSYPVSIGRTNAETPVALWRIDSKYRTNPDGAFGPRKMRLYRKVGSRYVYTAYNIHGTNQPWTIGTKASAGCIRLYNVDILDLYPRVPLGTIVQTRE